VRKDGFIQQKRPKYTKYQKPYVYAFYPVAEKFCPQSPKLITKMIIDFIGVCLPDTRILHHESHKINESVETLDVKWCRFSSDDQWVVGQRTDNLLILLHVETGQSKELGVGLRIYDTRNVFLFASDNQQIIFATTDKTIEIINVTTGVHVRSIDHGDDVRYISLSTDDKLILTGGLFPNKVWDRETGKCLRNFAHWIYDCDIVIHWSITGQFCNKNEDVISYPYYGTLTYIRIWSIRWPWWGGRKLHHNDRINTYQLSADQTLLVSGSDDKTVCVWQLPNGKKCQTFRNHTGAVEVCSFVRNDTQVVSMDSANNVYIWRVTDGNIIHSIHNYPAFTNNFNRSYWIASKNSECIIVHTVLNLRVKSNFLDIESGSEIFQSDQSNDENTCIEDVSSDGRFMIVRYWYDYGQKRRTELRDVQSIK